MALNFDLLQPANIRENFMAGRKEAQDMETGRLQQQEARLKLDDFQRKQAGLDKFLAAAKQRGKDGDPVDVADDYYNWTVSQGSPELITQAITLRQTAQQRKDYFAKQNPNQLAGAVQPVAPVAGALGSGTFDPNAPAPSAAAPLNALTPSAAAPSVMTPTNALAPTAAAAPAKQNRINFIRSELQRLSKYPNVSEAKAEATMLLDEYKRLTTPHVVGGSLMSGAGDVIGTVPKEVTPPASALEFKLAQEDPKFMQFLRERAAASRPPRAEAAPRTQQVTLSDGSLGIMNMDTGAITPATLGGEGVKGKDSTKTAVSEQQAAYNIGRVLTAANEIKNITSKNPSAVQPGAMEAFASSLGMGGTANLARDADRQIVQGAQRDALDALLYLATGAAYNKEQLQGQMDAYIPSYTDTDEAVVAKKSRMTELIKSAKTRAGKSWTPEMDKAMAALTGPAAPGAAAPAPAGGGGFKYLGKESN